MVEKTCFLKFPEIAKFFDWIPNTTGALNARHAYSKLLEPNSRLVRCES